MSILLNYPKFMAFDDKGIPLVGGKIYTYIAGTTTAKATYSDKDLAVANTNPVVLDRRGEAVIYGAGSYKFVFKDTDLNTIWTMDNIELSAESYCFYPDPSEADHATPSTGGSIKDILTALGTSKKAEIVFVNTCAFISSGRDEASETVNKLLKAKKTVYLM